jgi:hypothetical protein
VEFNTAAGGHGTTPGQGYGGGLFIQSGASVFLDDFTVAHTDHNFADIDPDIDGTYVVQSC